MIYEIKHRHSGVVLFSLECDSLKWCVEAAVTALADLRGADLRGANLGGANLGGADLGGADLRGAYLGGAKWRDGIAINRAPIQIYNLEAGWPVTILDEHMQIGCELHTFAEWRAFTVREIAAMDNDALKFWKRYGPVLLAMCESREKEMTK